MWLHGRQCWAPGYPVSSHALLSGLPTTEAVMVPSSDSRPNPDKQVLGAGIWVYVGDPQFEEAGRQGGSGACL